MNQPAQLSVPETYEEKVARLRVPDGFEPGPRGSFRSFTVNGHVSVTIHITWFVSLGWYFGIEVWDSSRSRRSSPAPLVAPAGARST